MIIGVEYRYPRASLLIRGLESGQRGFFIGEKGHEKTAIGNGLWRSVVVRSEFCSSRRHGGEGAAAGGSDRAAVHLDRLLPRWQPWRRLGTALRHRCVR